MESPHTVSAEMRDLILRVAARPRGLALLHLADLECAAIILGVHPRVIANARDLLETPSGRKWLIERVRSERVRLQSSPSPCPSRFRPRVPWVEHPGPDTAAELVREVTEHEYGPAFLLEAPPETVAITFHTHPEVVLRARRVLKRWISRSATRSHR